MKKIDLSKMYVDDEIKKAAVEVLESGKYIKGPKVEQFEEKLEEKEYQKLKEKNK